MPGEGRRKGNGTKKNAAHTRTGGKKILEKKKRLEKPQKVFKERRQATRRQKSSQPGGKQFDEKKKNRKPGSSQPKIRRGKGGEKSCQERNEGSYSKNLGKPPTRLKGGGEIAERISTNGTTRKVRKRRNKTENRKKVSPVF